VINYKYIEFFALTKGKATIKINFKKLIMIKVMRERVALDGLKESRWRVRTGKLAMAKYVPKPQAELK
jgi:hypothetical protein